MKNERVKELEAQIARNARIAENTEFNLGKKEEKLARVEGSLQRAEGRVKETTIEGNYNTTFWDMTTMDTPRKMTDGPANEMDVDSSVTDDGDTDGSVTDGRDDKIAIKQEPKHLKKEDQIVKLLMQNSDETTEREYTIPDFFISQG